MRTVTPTRQNYHRIRDQIELAERGQDVLSRKLDGLIMEFMDILDQYESLQGDLATTYETAQSELDRVRALEGDTALRGIVRARKNHPALTVTYRNIMGVRIPQIESSTISSPVGEHGYGLLGTSPAIDEVVDAYEELLEQIVVIAEVETAIQRLIDEIQATNRRVNALEQSVIPRLYHQQKYIRRRLDQREREERIRQKWIKNKKEREESTHRSARAESDDQGRTGDPNRASDDGEPRPVPHPPGKRQ